MLCLIQSSRKIYCSIFLIEKIWSDFPDIFLCTVSKCHGFQNGSVQPLLEIREGDLYFCLEERTVCVGSQEIELTAKEFDALHLLIVNKKRVLTLRP